MDEKKFRLWMEKNKSYNTARTYTARCIRLKMKWELILMSSMKKMKEIV